MEIKISRLDQYPAEEPCGFCVGFSITCDNGKSFYQDTNVSFDEAKTSEEAVDKAWEKLKEGVISTDTTLGAKSALLGTVYTPKEV